jgi:hypothetical protein
MRDFVSITCKIKVPVEGTHRIYRDPYDEIEEDDDMETETAIYTPTEEDLLDFYGYIPEDSEYEDDEAFAQWLVEEGRVAAD